jgi:hypothetical protein
LKPVPPSPTRSPSTRPAPPVLPRLAPASVSVYPPSPIFIPTRVCAAAPPTWVRPVVSYVMWPDHVSPVPRPARSSAPAPPLPERPPVSWPATAPIVAVQNAVRTQSSLNAESSSGRERYFRSDTLLHGVGLAVHGRIVALNKSPTASGAQGATASSPQAFSDRQIYAMSSAWMAACLTGRASIAGEASHTRTCAVTLQHFVEKWLTDRMHVQQSRLAPFVVLAAIHTPAPASPLRQRPDAPVSTTLLAPHLRDDANVQATVMNRAGSLRGLLDAGATLHVCYSADSLNAMSADERDAYRSTCATYPGNLIDVPLALPADAFHASCGATYVFGASLQSLTGCFAIRMPQAADAAPGMAGAELLVTSPIDSLFRPVLDELTLRFGLQLDSAGAVAKHPV